jgi:alanine racemase
MHQKKQKKKKQKKTKTLIRGPVARINLSAIAHNFQSVKKIVQNRPVIAVVKADAYGHGAAAVSTRLLKEGASCLAVAYTGEARELRDAGINAPILVLFDRGDIKEYFVYRLIPVLYDTDTAKALSREAQKRKTTLKVHIKIDTGMGRLGLHGKHIMDDLLRISGMTGLEIEGLLSHFSEADLADRSYAIEQLEKFQKIKEAISRIVKKRVFSHIGNSAAVLSYSQAYLDAVRPGIVLYGYSPFVKNPAAECSKPGKGRSSSVKFLPAMTVATKILSIRNVPKGTPISYGRTFVTKKQSRIGVLPLGYADGYSRLFSNNADVLVRGERAPIVGRVCMDLTMVGVSGIKGVKENDEVVLIGKQGRGEITAQELAERAGTIPYEILTSIGSRAQRVYG